MIKQLNIKALTNSIPVSFAYNGMLKDDEIQGVGNSYTAEFWQYDSRLGRRWNQDPVVKEWQSNYHTFSNNPIAKTDPLGSSDDWVGSKDENGVTHWTWEKDIKTEEQAKKAGFDDFKKDGSILKDARLGNGPKGDVYLGMNGQARYATAEDLKQPELFVQPSNHTPDEPYGYMKGVTLDGLDFGGGPRDINNFNLSQRSINFNNALNRLALTNLLVTGSPLIGYSLITMSPILGASSKFWYVKAGVSATSQAIINKGDINLIGVATDGFLGYGSSSIIQSSINFKYNLITGNNSMTSIFQTGNNNISIEQMAFESTVGIVFGYKQNFVTNGYYKAFGAGRPTFGRALGKEFYGSTLYTFPSNGLNKQYEDAHQ